MGRLSNMNNDFPWWVNGVRIGSSEALYQACRFPHQPDWQQEILNAPHAIAAKMKAKKEGRLLTHIGAAHPDVKMQGIVLGEAVVLQTDRGEFTLQPIERFN